MKRYHSIKTYMAAALLLAASVSCEDELDLYPISQEVADNAYSTGTQIEAALTGVYESFQSSQYYAWDFVMAEDIRSDNYYAGGDNPEIFAYDRVDLSPTNSRVNALWASVYNAISKANLVLEKTPEVTENITEERKDQILGEAYFLRAYHYFVLVKNFGDVPLYINFVSSADPADTRLPRSSKEEVYAQIVSDLNNALTRLPDTYGSDASVNKARATKGAANALLAKVYAQMPTPDYTAVLAHANAVINSPAGYSLLSNYDELFDGNHYNNAESIIEIQYLGGNEGNWGPQMHLPPSVSGDNWRKFTTPSHDLVDAFDSEGDNIRKNATILFENVSWVDEYWGNATNSSVPFAYKWRNAGSWASSDDIYLLRLADIILMKAEAQNELGQTADAATTVNLVRNRAGLANLNSDATASQSAMRMAILKERRLELAQEGHRWSDLVRFGMAQEVMNSVDDIDLSTGQSVNYAVDEHDLLMPIPQAEINRNPNLEQNPGY
ncbi:Starch-binding associating with outer membrane [Pustulibacterium marinum]|uniref:Starch-binding associating with outer membrane n=1 Tax=Pustulibacterium marinum TaxID=1224947 RepID=A0A1I7G0D1_9FLAO|nr:RagB/SusD family nutrient uptake outer membrane protein [Pustulibacterium marinum]SFU41893.1 Starch-binding associating with outer membrane [Pustulibacterium marinum]